MKKISTDILSQNNINLYRRPIRPFLSRCEKRVFYIYFTNDSGRRTKTSTHTTLRAQAEREYSKFMKSQSPDVIQRSLPKQVKITDHLELIIKAFSFRKSLNTLSLYRLAFKHLGGVLGNKQISTITRFDADYFVNSLLSRKLQWTSKNIYLRHLKAAFNIAIDYGLIEENPFKHIQELTVPDKIRPIFNDEEWQLLFSVVKDPYLLRVTKFALLTGMRLSEIAFLQWKDIDLNEQKINVHNKEGFKTKTRKNRVIAITETILKVLESDRTGNSANVYCLRDMNAYVFGKESGFQFTPQNISHKFKKAVRKASLNDKICFHSLRHTALTKMALNGVPIYILKEIAGHASISTTQKYLHCDIASMNKFMSQVDFGF